MAGEALAALNIVVMILVGVVFIIRTNDIVKDLKSTIEWLSKANILLDKRVTIIETVCAMNHPASAKELLTIQQ